MLSLVQYPQLEKFPFPRGSPSISKDSNGPMYATVDMQSTAEEKQQAVPRISHYGTFVCGTCMAERDFYVVLKAVFRLVGI